MRILSIFTQITLFYRSLFFASQIRIQFQHEVHDNRIILFIHCFSSCLFIFCFFFSSIRIPFPSHEDADAVSQSLNAERQIRKTLKRTSSVDGTTLIMFFFAFFLEKMLIFIYNFIYSHFVSTDLHLLRSNVKGTFELLKLADDVLIFADDVNKD